MKPNSSRRRAWVSAAVLAVILAIAAVVLLTTSVTESEVDTAASQSGARGGESLQTIPLPLGLQPEGITSDGESTFYVGSLADGRVIRGDLDSGDTEVLVPGITGRVAVGMRFEDRDEGRLWVAGGPTGAVTVYDADSGDELGRWVVPGSGFLNDVTVTEDAAYVTDSQVQRLVVVPLGDDGALPGPDAATTLPLTGDVSFDPDDFNANGITALDDDLLVLVQSSTGMLFLVDPATGVTDAIEGTEGDLVSGDGLELGAGRLFVVRGGGGNDVAVVRLRQNGRSARVERVVTQPDFDVPTTATFADGRLWAVNARFDTEPTPTTEYTVVQVDVD
jgi:sugar lactone lactonase YvrE